MTVIQNLTFAEALSALQLNSGNSYIRIDNKWSDDVKIKIQYADYDTDMTAPYLYVDSRFGRVPWVPTQIEMLTEVWTLVAE